MRTAQRLVLVLVLGLACSSSKTPGSGTGGTGGGDGGAAGHVGATDAGGMDAAAAGTTGSAGHDAGDASVDTGTSLAPSCAPGGPGMTTCGTASENCCLSAVVTGGTFNRTYTPADGGAAATSADGGAAGGTDPASVSDFRLDKYDVTVGRFRQFVKVVMPGVVVGADGGADASDGGDAGDDGGSDAAAGWRPAAGSGKHAHLNGGLGLKDVGTAADAGAATEPGWAVSDDSAISPTDAHLSSCGAASTWTSAAGAQENLPINCVTWAEAYAFCIWDGGFLPSEAEWEYAAAGGSQQRTYPWGAADPGTMNHYAIYDCNYPNSTTDCSTAASIAPVGTAPAGAGVWGQLDLSGNLWQLNLDWYASYVTPCVDCANVSGGSSRMLRGGAFREDGTALSAQTRNANNPNIRNDFIGFRCARKP